MQRVIETVENNERGYYVRLINTNSILNLLSIHLLLSFDFLPLKFSILLPTKCHPLLSFSIKLGNHLFKPNPMGLAERGHECSNLTEVEHSKYQDNWRVCLIAKFQD